ncbi:hypothetical protein D3C71_1851470 [compost metagenome]
MTIDVALKHETLAQTARQLFGGALCVIGVVGVGFAGQQHVQRVVPVIVPLGIETLLQQAGLIVFVFHHQPDMAQRIGLAANPLCKLLKEIRVFDGVDRV